MLHKFIVLGFTVIITVESYTTYPLSAKTTNSFALDSYSGGIILFEKRKRKII